MEAYVTLCTTDGYAVGAQVLAHSLRSHGTSRQLVVMVTPGVTQGLRASLATVFDAVVMVDVLDSSDAAHLALMQRPELGVTFTKLHCWTLTQYSKCVFLDADTLALQNIDELFSKPELSAACDIGWPDCFNSGMFVFTPSQDTYEGLIKFAQEKGSFDGGDQGLLNMYFPEWNRVSFVFNMVASATYTYTPAFKQFGKDVRLVHFLGAVKPWHGQPSHHTCGAFEGYVQAWWAIYKHTVEPSLPADCTSSDPSPSHSSPPQPHQFVPHQAAGSGLAQQLAAASLTEDLQESRRRWEEGQPEYMGRDSMDNILAYIDKKVETANGNGDK